MNYTTPLTFAEITTGPPPIRCPLGSLTIEQGERLDAFEAHQRYIRHPAVSCGLVHTPEAAAEFTRRAEELGIGVDDLARLIASRPWPSDALDSLEYALAAQGRP